MEYRNLGRSGLKVSELCMGSLYYGRDMEEATCHGMLDRFHAAGGNFIDTSDVYGPSEGVIGRWLEKKQREDFVIATKVRFDTSEFWPGTGPNHTGLSRKHIMEAVEGSLRRLQTDYIDLYIFHCWDQSTPLEESLAAMDRLVQSGKIRYIGISNFLGWQLQKAVDLCQMMGLERIACLQACYNLLDRQMEWDVLQVCRNESLGLMCWSPLAGGWLTGLIKRGMTKAPKKSRIERAEKGGWSESWTNYNTDHTWTVLDAFDEVVKETGRTPSQVALNWLLRRPLVTSTITGADSLAQLEDNLEALTWALTEAQMKRLNAVSIHPPPRYPYGFINRFNNTASHIP